MSEPAAGDDCGFVPPVIGVSEVVLSVADLPAMREFYVNTLGFAVHSEISMETETRDPDGEPTISFLTISEHDTPLARAGHPQFLVLIDYKRHVFAKGRLVGHDVTRSTLNHLAFEIPGDSYGASKLWLESRDIGVTESVFPTFGARALFFNDPEGNTLELICAG